MYQSSLYLDVFGSQNTPSARTKMNTRKSNEEPQVNRSQTTEEQSQSMNTDRPGYHYVKHHGYTLDDFAEDGETSQFNGIRVVDESESVESEVFDGFKALMQSNWEVKYASAARLNDGVVLYEGSR